jgi:hypothetical protein
MAKNKIQAPIVIIVFILLTTGLIIALNLKNNSSTDTNQATTLTENAAIDETPTVWVPGALVINELMADNDKAVQTIFGGYPDWIELFNSGNSAIDLGGMYLTDDLTKLGWAFPNETIIEPNSYLLVWADADTGRSSLQVNFNLLANGGIVGLFASDGKTLIDLVLYEKQIRDISYGRIPNGGLGWDYLDTPTPGKANVENARATVSAPWQIWLLIILAITVCVAVLLKDNIRARRKK